MNIFYHYINTVGLIAVCNKYYYTKEKYKRFVDLSLVIKTLHLLHPMSTERNNYDEVH